jgi:hypothetical protein
LPITLGNYAASLEVGKRAKISGITYLILALLTAVLSVLVLNNLVFTCIILASIRLTGLFAFRMLGKKDEFPEEDSLEKTANISLQKNFLLFFVPWAIFCLVDYLTVPLIQNAFQSYGDFISLSPVIESVIIAITAVISGILADRVGRKRLIMVGFVMLGIGFAALSLFVKSTLENAPIIAGYIYTVSDGVAWGIFYVIFMLTLWGDLAKNQKGKILYAIGTLPYIFGNVFRLSLQGDLLANVPDPTQVFSFASIFLFLAVIPLLYAPETLSEKIIANQELNSYVNKALEKVKKETTKKRKNNSDGETKMNETTNLEGSPENNNKYDEARKLAEKYY